MDKGRIVERGRHDELLANATACMRSCGTCSQQQRVRPARAARWPPAVRPGGAAGRRGRRAARGRSRPPRRARTPTSTWRTPRRRRPERAVAGVVRSLARAVRATPPRRPHRAAAAAPRRQRAAERRPTAATPATPLPRRPASPARRAADSDSAPLDPLELRSDHRAPGRPFDVEPPARPRGMRYVLELPLRAVAVPSRAARCAATRPVPCSRRTRSTACGDEHRRPGRCARVAADAAASWKARWCCRFGSGRRRSSGSSSTTRRWPRRAGVRHHARRRGRPPGRAPRAPARGARGVPPPQRLPAMALTGLRTPRRSRCAR